MYRGLFLTIIAILAVTNLAWSAEISTSDKLVSIKAENEPFGEILMQLGATFNFKVSMPTSVKSKTISISRSNTKLKTLLRELLRDYSHIIYWSDYPNIKEKRIDLITIISVKQSPLGVKTVSQSVLPDEEYLAKSTSAKNPDSVEAKIDALTNTIGTPDEQYKLMLALQDPSSEVRIAALEQISLLGTPQARQLIETAQGDGDPAVREVARQLIEEINNDEVKQE